MSELGQALREAREAKGLSLEDLQEITKIQKRYLMALESGDFKQLPGNFYTRAFIKNYAENVGLEAQEFFDEHAGEIPKAQTEPVDPIIPSRSTVHKPKKQPTRRVSRGSKVESMLPKVLLIVLILILLVAVWIVMQQVTGRSSHSGTSGSNGVNVSYKKEKTKTTQPQQNKTQSKTTDKSKQKSTTKKESKPSFVLTKDSSSGNVTYYTLSKASEFKMGIKSSDGKNSWISATDTSTNKQYALGTVNQTTSFNFDASSSKQILINIGSVPDTSITIDGKPFKFPNNNITQRIYITYKK